MRFKQFSTLFHKLPHVRYLSLIFQLFLLLLLYVFLYKTYIPRVNAFGCFDDCFNFGAGYFLTKGKVLYSEVFFNHQPIPAYISALVQQITDPINIFDLVLKHRQTLMLWSFIFNALLIFRFGFSGLVFAAIYEPTKFYVFGDRFLGEGFLVYPLVYLTGLVIERLAKNRHPEFKSVTLNILSGSVFDFPRKITHLIDPILAGIFTWFIIFTRTPAAPAALFLFGMLLITAENKRHRIISLTVFLGLTLFTLSQFPIKDYLFNIYTVNRGIISAHIAGQKSSLTRLGTILFYPITIFFSGERTILRVVLIWINVVFFGSILMLLKSLFEKRNKHVALSQATTRIATTKTTSFIIVTILILSIINLRPSPPGTVFYEAFHMIPWYGVFIFITILLARSIQRIHKPNGTILLGMLLLIPLYMMVSPKSFANETIDQHAEYITNYGDLQHVGDTIRTLSNNDTTLFVDGFDELIHWQTDLPSTYKYNWYTSTMPLIPRYADARIEMFTTNPPDIYYGSCPKEATPYRLLPEFVKDDYIRLLKFGEPSCIFVHVNALEKISEDQWNEAEEKGYSKPNTLQQ